METTFTPIASFAGGVLIGLSAILLMLFMGRIAGATGVLIGLFFPQNMMDWLWRAAMLAGMLAAPVGLLLITGKTPEINVEASTAVLIISGLIVGTGAMLGSGCTSGHGVCGMARFSRRSLAAVVTFMTVTAATVYVTRHMLGG